MLRLSGSVRFGSERKRCFALRFLNGRFRRRCGLRSLRAGARSGRRFLRGSFFGLGGLLELGDDHRRRRDHWSALFLRGLLADANRRLHDRARRADSFLLLLNLRFVFAQNDRARASRELFPGDDCLDHLRLEYLI
jgi:hypothetical protein